MPILTKQFELALKSGKKITCKSCGTGSRHAYIIGPGSFYFNSLEALHNVYTFYACDTYWAYTKPDTLRPDEELRKINKLTLKEQDHEIVLALKQYLNISIIDGFAFSAPGLLLLEEAHDYSEDFDRIIGTGIGVTELDPTFEKTNQFFKCEASPERVKTFETCYHRYQTLTTTRENNPNLKFFDLKSTTDTTKKPHKLFVAETLSMIAKLLYNHNDINKGREIVIKHWKRNTVGEHIDKRFQKVFFETIYPTMNPEKIFQNLEKTNNKILLIFGKHDFVTPLPEKQQKLISQHPKITLSIVDQTSHMVYLENQSLYKEIVETFLESTISNKAEQTSHVNLT